MWKTKNILGFLLYLNVQSFCINSIHGRAFIICHDLDDNLKADSPLFDLFLSSRLLCGIKCTEQGYMCLSYAWNRDSNRFILFNQRCSNDTHQTEKSLEHYEIQGDVCMYINYFNKCIVNNFGVRVYVFFFLLHHIDIHKQRRLNYSDYLILLNLKKKLFGT